MKRTNVTSSDIKSIGYNEADKILEIEFHSGEIYRYSDVPKYEFENLLNVNSKGKYFHQNIKGKYNCNKVG